MQSIFAKTLKFSTMKKLISKISTFALVIATMVQGVSAQSDSAGHEDEYHIKIVKVDGNKKTELDTIVSNDSPFVWNGDTINPVNGMVFMSSKNGNSEVFHFNFRDSMGQELFIVSNTKKTDSIRKEIEKSISKWSKGSMVNIPFNHRKLDSGDAVSYFLRKDQDEINIINLSDPGIISYKKKDLSNGREKITIVRKKMKKKEGEEKEITIDIEDIKKGS